MSLLFTTSGFWGFSTLAQGAVLLVAINVQRAGNLFLFHPTCDEQPVTDGCSISFWWWKPFPSLTMSWLLLDTIFFEENPNKPWIYGIVKLWATLITSKQLWTIRGHYSYHEPLYWDPISHFSIATCSSPAPIITVELSSPQCLACAMQCRGRGGAAAIRFHQCF